MVCLSKVSWFILRKSVAIIVATDLGSLGQNNHGRFRPLLKDDVLGSLDGERNIGRVILVVNCPWNEVVFFVVVVA